MTLPHLTAEVERLRKLEAEQPCSYYDEMIAGMRQRAAILERFFLLGAYTTQEEVDDVFPQELNTQNALAWGLADLAKDIRLAADWLDARERGAAR